MKKFLFITLALLICSWTNVHASEVIYSWQSDGTVTEIGGTATSMITEGNVNKSQAGYYTICLSGKKTDYPASAYVNVSLDQPLADGDVITVTAFRNKNATGKNVTIEFLFGGSTENSIASKEQFANINPDGEADPAPTTQTFTVPATAAGCTFFDMTRGTAGTNLFITKIEITRETSEEPDQPTEPTVLYERTADTWTEADLTEWVNDNSQYVTQTIDGGLKMTGTNSGWNSTKEITFTENSIVTLTATLNGGSATGRPGSYDFLKLGGVEVRLDGQNSAASIVIGDTPTSISGFVRGGDYEISMTINQASKDVTVTVSGGAEGTAEGKLTEALPNNVIVGHYKAGKENYAVNEILKAIKITEEIQQIAIAPYTVNYLLNGTKIKTESGEMAVGSEVTAISPLTIDGNKYYFADGATTSMTVQAGNENVLNVEMRAAYNFNYTVSNNVNGEFKSGTCEEGESVTVPFSLYILASDGIVWKYPAIKNQEYKYTFTPDRDNFVATLEYEATDMTDGIWFAEAEDIEGLTATENGQIAARGSNAAGAYSAEAVKVYTLKPGTYKVTAAVAGNAGATIQINAGDQNIITAETVGWWAESSSEEFTVETETEITVQGGESQKPLDYILITGTENPVIEVSEITLNETKATLKVGDTLELKATVTPEDASDATVTWNSNDENVVTIDENGKVTAIAEGQATITASAGEKTATCVITVEPAVVEVETITLNQTEATIKVGETLELKATVTPEDATEATVTWTSSNEAVATVDENGKVTAVAEGEATITAKAGDKTAECKVKVDKTTGVALLGFDPEAPIKVYNLNGIYVSDSIENLQKGYYIIRQGDNTKKVIIR